MCPGAALPFFERRAIIGIDRFLWRRIIRMRKLIALALLALVGVATIAAPALACPTENSDNQS